MDFRKELEQMRANYKKKPPRKIHLPRFLLSPSDPLRVIYREKDVLVKNGEIYYAHVVQANVILFRMFPHYDCPAALLYAADDTVSDNPMILQDIAHQLFSYKNKNLNEVPEQWREIARCITDEYDRSSYTFSVPKEEGSSFKVYYIANMIFRKYLPRRMLCGSLLPVLAIPGQCESVLILPQKYWTKTFRDAWVMGII